MPHRNTPAPRIPAHYLARLEAHLHRGQRTLIGVVGAPGAGKSTLAQGLQQAFAEHSQVVPMDGFHLANSELARLGLTHCKGAPETFDSAGYVALLQRLRQQAPGEVIYAPDFRRSVDESIAGAIALFSHTALLICEGNYLLLDEGPWAHITELLDEVWFIAVDDNLRNQRLVQRHMQFGRSQEAAEAWVEHTDGPNARRIAQTQARADVVFRWDEATP